MSRWLFAFRIWVAIQLALSVAFWVQLDGASTAGVVAALLAAQTRGQAFEKGCYLLLGTAVGGAMAIVIVGLFAQVRDLDVVAYSIWLAVCVFGASFLDGNRAYDPFKHGGAGVARPYSAANRALLPCSAPECRASRRASGCREGAGW